MRIKRFLALVLACALTAGLLILPSSAARQPSAFPDITDEATAEAAEILRLLASSAAPAPATLSRAAP